MSHEEGIRLAAAGRLEEAAKVLLNYVEKVNTEDAAAFNNLGNILSDLSRPDEARKYYERALELKPSFFEARRNYAALLSEIGARGEAIEAYLEALRCKEDADMHYNLGNLYSEQGDFAAAERHYRQSLGISRSAHAHNNLGLLLHTRGQVHAAASHYLEAIQLDPQSKDAKCNLGVSLRALGDTSGAMRRLEEAVLIDGECHKAHFQLGVMKQMMSLVPVAVDHLKEAVRIQPGVPLYRVALLLALRSLHRTEEMNECMKSVMSNLARAAVASSGAGSESARDLAMLLLLLGRRGDAVRVLARLPPPPFPHPGPGPYLSATLSLSRLPSRGGEVAQSLVHAWVQLRRRKTSAGVPPGSILRFAMDEETMQEAIDDALQEAKVEKGQGVWMLVAEHVDRIEPVAVDLDPAVLAKAIKPGQSCLLLPEIMPPLIFEGRKSILRMFLLVSLSHGSFLFSEGVLILARKPYVAANADPEIHITSLTKQKDTGFDFFSSQLVASKHIEKAVWKKILVQSSTLALSLSLLLRTPDIALPSSIAAAASGGGDNSATASSNPPSELFFQFLSFDLMLKDDGSVYLFDIAENAKIEKEAYTKDSWNFCVSSAAAMSIDALGAENSGDGLSLPRQGGGDWELPETPVWIGLQ